ncbi:MAG: MFS transporter [Patescibacteria group bacterium]|nr:MFS transporter [Patescibacteria group bacterium]
MDKQNKVDTLKKSRSNSIKENIYANLAVGFGDYYISPCAIALKTTPFWLGILNSMPTIGGSLVQLLGNYFIKKSSRKKIVIIAIAFQTFLFFLISLLSYLIFINLNFSFHYLIILFTLYVIAGSVAAPAFISWLGDLVDTKQLADYFGLRNSIGVAFNIIAVIFGGLILDFFKLNNESNVFFGFALIFLLASIFHLIRIKIMKNIYEPSFQPQEESYFSFYQFIKRLPRGIFGKLVIISALIIFASNISGPYYNLYIFRDLKFSYSQFLILQVSATIGSFLAFFFWAKLSNHLGHLKVLKINTFFIFLPAILWYFTIYMDSVMAFIFLIPVQFLGGIFWAGFGLASGNFFYTIVSRQKRNLCFAYSNIIYALAIVLGSIIGSYLIEIWEDAKINSIMLVSLFSSFLRFIFALLLIILLKEPASIKKITISDEIQQIKRFIVMETKIFINEIFSLPLLIKKIIRKVKS